MPGLLSRVGGVNDPGGGKAAMVRQVGQACNEKLGGTGQVGVSLAGAKMSSDYEQVKRSCMSQVGQARWGWAWQGQAPPLHVISS